MCCTLFRNPVHYLGMHTIKEGTLNAVNTVVVLFICWKSCMEVSLKHAMRKQYRWKKKKVNPGDEDTIDGTSLNVGIFLSYNTYKRSF